MNVNKKEDAVPMFCTGSKGLDALILQDPRSCLAEALVKTDGLRIVDDRPALETTSPGTATRLIGVGALCRGLRWSVGIGPWPFRKLR